MLECSLGNRPERRFTGLFIGDLADSIGGYTHNHMQVRYYSEEVNERVASFLKNNVY